MPALALDIVNHHVILGFSSSYSSSPPFLLDTTIHAGTTAGSKHSYSWGRGAGNDGHCDAEGGAGFCIAFVYTAQYCAVLFPSPLALNSTSKRKSPHFMFSLFLFPPPQLLHSLPCPALRPLYCIMLCSTVKTNHYSNNIIDIKFNKKKCKKKEREEYRGPRLLQNACIHYRYNISFPPFLSNLGDLCFSVCPPASCTARIVQHCSLRTTYLPTFLPAYLPSCLLVCLPHVQHVCARPSVLAT